MTRNLPAVLFLLLAFSTTCGGGGVSNCPPLPDTVGKTDGAEDASTDVTIPTDAPSEPGTNDLWDLAGEPSKGAFGAACIANTDCDSGFCVEGVNGFVCTVPCLEVCPGGWVCRGILVGPDLISLCVPSGAMLCKSCKLDAQCGGGLCLEQAGGQFCGKDCEAVNCPDGYDCEAVDVGGLTKKQCLPRSGACDCTVTSHGTEKPCVRDNEHGTCLGFETCDMDHGWLGCTALVPAPEECNGIDDDCNGAPDDGVDPPQEQCENVVPGVGACPGQWICAGDAGWDCVGPSPKAEECNYIDDDCDGDTDEDFKGEGGQYNMLENCGQCGNHCEGKIPFVQIVACDDTFETPTCVVVECQSGYYKASDILCLPQISYLCIPCVEDVNCGATGDQCLDLAAGKYCGRDCSQGSVFGQDCPVGYECQDFGDGARQCVPQSGSCDCTPANEGISRVCAIENGFGTCTGTETCDSALGWVNCTSKTPSAEICNGLDDDCDGFVDLGLDPPPELCEKTWTDPATGETFTCTAPWECTEGGEGTVWVCNAKQPGFELCNYVDDNCNGAIDEDYKVPGTGKYGAFDHCGACGVSCEDVIPNGTEKCDATGLQPRCVVDECDDGYWQASDLSCAEFPDTLCKQCAADKACQVPGDTCEDLVADGKSFCLWDCSTESLHPDLGAGQGACPTGYICIETDAQGQPFFQCVPLSGSCECLDSNAGEIRLCQVTTDLGTCVGQETCDPDSGWVGCTAVPPAAETCNGVDDDCDGSLDEEWPEKGKACLGGVGECQRAGTRNCTPDGMDLECDAVPGAPIDESCDLLDNDCDGDTDEDFIQDGKYYLDTMCGNCFTNCLLIYNLANSYGTCDVTGTPKCMMNCHEGYYDLNEIPDDGCEFYLDPEVIFVSSDDPAALDDETCGLGPTGTGTGAYPCLSITQGIARILAEGRQSVVVADGLYEETITLVNGISLLGGYRADTWERHLTSSLSTVRGSGSGLHKSAFVAEGIADPTLVQGFIVYGPVNGSPGGNSYGFYVKASGAGLQILDNVIYSGSGGAGASQQAGTKGADGADGEGRDPGDPSAYDAIVTNSHPCNQKNNRWYENGGEMQCGNDNVDGGRGGGNRCPPNGDNEYSGRDGQSGSSGAGSGGGDNGSGGDAGNDGTMSGTCWLPGSPMTGSDGANGTKGDDGAGGLGCVEPLGGVVGDHWSGGGAGAGVTGFNGGGGGGGGAGGGGECLSGCSGDDRLGGHGGGGGSGGCKGSSGAGGGAGGAAFGVFIVGGEAPVIENNHVFLGIGGGGGDGGNGGVGGTGGHGGDGGKCPGSCWCHKSAGKGGEGGDGGHGGGGGGGCAGASFGVYTWDVAGAPFYCSSPTGNVFSGGSPSSGGSGGNSFGNSGTPGSYGTVLQCSLNNS